MANAKTPFVRKLEKLQTKSFPAPASVKLEDHDGIIGVIRSTEFAGMETIDRQNRIGKIAEFKLSPQERRRVQVIVGVHRTSSSRPSWSSTSDS